MLKMDSKEETDGNTNLDRLLDDALEDFNKPVLPKAETEAKVSEDTSETANVWTEEFIQEATKNFEKSMRQMMASQQAGQEQHESFAQPEPNIDAFANEFMKMAGNSNTESKPKETDFAACIDQTMKQVHTNAGDIKAPPSADDLSQLFSNLGMGTGQQEGGMPGMFSLMQSMLENILSKEVLYEPIKDIVLKYPEWLADNRSTVSEEDFKRYNEQFVIMKEVTDMFENGKDSESEEAKAKSFEEVLKHMQKLQNLGQPPAALMGEFENPLNFDGDGSANDISRLLESVGQSSNLFDPATGTTSAPNEQDQCTLM